MSTPNTTNYVYNAVYLNGEKVIDISNTDTSPDEVDAGNVYYGPDGQPMVGSKDVITSQANFTNEDSTSGTYIKNRISLRPSNLDDVVDAIIHVDSGNDDMYGDNASKAYSSKSIALNSENISGANILPISAIEILPNTNNISGKIYLSDSIQRNVLVGMSGDENLIKKTSVANILAKYPHNHDFYEVSSSQIAIFLEDIDGNTTIKLGITTEKIVSEGNDSILYFPFEISTNTPLLDAEKTKYNAVYCILLDRPDLGILNNKGENSIATGLSNKALSASNFVSGTNNITLGENAISSGNNNFSIGNNSVTFGVNNRSIGDNSTSFGSNNITIGENSLSIGKNTKSSASYSFAGGYNTSAIGSGAFAFGSNNHASGCWSVALGKLSYATDEGSIAMGKGLRAYGAYQTIFGKYNLESSSEKYALIVGNGSSGARSNAFDLTWEGSGHFYKDLLIDNILTSNEKIISKKETLLEGTLKVDASSKFNNNVEILNSNFTVTGETYLKKTNITSNFSVNGDSIFTGEMNINGNMNLEESATLKKDLTVKGNTVLNKNLTIGNDFVYFNSNNKTININGSISSDINADENVNITKDLNVNGVTTLNNNLNVIGDAKITNSLSIGEGSVSTSKYSIAVGLNCSSKGNGGMALGSSCHANGYYSLAVGKFAATNKGTESSIAAGYGAKTNCPSQAVFGCYNEIDNEGKFALIIGGGNPEFNDNGNLISEYRKNIFDLTWDGTGHFYRDLAVNKNLVIGGSSEFTGTTLFKNVVSIPENTLYAKFIDVDSLNINKSLKSGSNLIAHPGQTVIGKYNLESIDDNHIFIIGCGNDSNSRENALEVLLREDNVCETKVSHLLTSSDVFSANQSCFWGISKFKGLIRSENNISTTGTLDVEGNITTNSNLIVDGSTMLKDTDISGDLVVSGVIEGSTNAATAMFNEDFKVTMDFGKYKRDANGIVTIPAAGKSVYELILDAFTNTSIDVTQPTVSISANGASTTLEVGESVVPKYNISFTQGKYQYGTTTNTSKPANSTLSPRYSVTFNGENNVTKTTSSGEFSSIKRNSTGSHTITAVTSWEKDASIPVDALNNELPAMSISAGSKTISITFNWYKYCYYGFKNSAMSINSANIRSLTKYKSETPTTTVTTNSSWTHFYYAAPGTKKIVAAKDSNNVPLTVKNIVIDVLNADGSASNSYTVSYIENDKSYSATTLTLTWG